MWTDQFNALVGGTPEISPASHLKQVIAREPHKLTKTARVAKTPTNDAFSRTDFPAKSQLAAGREAAKQHHANTSTMTAANSIHEESSCREEAVINTESTAHAVLVSTDDAINDALSASVVAIAGDDENDDIPLAIMELLPTEGSDSDECAERQAGIICVTVLKSKRRDVAGISLENTDDGLRISSIGTESIFHDTPIEVGDFLLSVNHLSCEQQNVAGAHRLIRQSRRTVTLVVHRHGGNPYLMSSTVMKPEPTTKVGIGIQIYNGALRVSSLDPHGLFSGGILNVGDKVVSICNVSCACMDSTSAIELIRQGESVITIVTWTEEEAGVVVAETKTGLLYGRYRAFVPCLFSVLILTIIALIVMLTSGDDASSSDDKERRCKNLYGAPTPYC